MTRRQRRPRVWVVPSTGARPRHPLIPCRKSSSRSGVARCVVLCYYMGERSARGVGDVCPVVIWWLLGRSTATSTSSSDISITGRSCWKIDIFRPYIDVTSKAGNCLPCVCGVLLCFFIIISTQCLRRKYCSVIQKKTRKCGNCECIATWGRRCSTQRQSFSNETPLQTLKSVNLSVPVL